MMGSEIHRTVGEHPGQQLRRSTTHTPAEYPRRTKRGAHPSDHNEGMVR